MARKINGVFVTGTDTECGKTLIAGGIARALLRKGFNVGVMKPVATWGDLWREPGQKNRWISEDALHLRQAAATSDALNLINPVCFKFPLAPWPAALQEKKKINLKKVFTAYHELAQRHDYLVVEGIGGVMVPIKRRFFVIDLIAKMRLAAVVVSGAALGAINHALLTVNALKSRQIPLAGVVVNNGKGKTLAERTNPNTLRRILERRVLVVPHQPRFANDFDAVARHLVKQGLFNWPYLP